MLVLIGMSLAAVAHASTKLNCGVDIEPSGMPLSYCITPGSSSRVIVFFPGVGSFANGWTSQMSQELATAMANQGGKPTILTMGVGPVQFLSGNVRISGLSDIEEVSRSIVNILKGHGLRNLDTNPGSIELYGESMGGFNSLQVFARHPEYFNRVALICPAGTRVSPFAPLSDWLVNMQEEAASPVLSIAFRETLTAAFGGEDQWEQQSPIMYLATSYRPMAVRQPIYLATVAGDKFGFTLVEDTLTSMLQSEGHQVTRNETFSSAHCFVNPAPLAAFLLK
jgi:pimeloyl-ACP methyl ester carboxylesterase